MSSSSASARATICSAPPAERYQLDGLLAAVQRGEEQPGGIVLPGEAVDPAVQGFGEVGDLAGLPFEHQQAPAVAFVTGAELRAPGQVLAVGRIARAGIGAGGRGDLDRIAAFDGHHVQIRIGAGGRHGVGIHGVADFLAVGRNVVIVGAAERKRRNVDGARGQVPGRSAGHGDREQVAAPAGLPARPMAVEQFGVDARLHWTGLLGVEVLLVAGVIGAAFGIHLAGKQQVLAVGGEQHAVGFGGEVGGRFGIAAVRVHQPDLGASAAVGNVGDPAGIGRPARARIGRPFVGDLPRLAVALQRHRPDLRWLLVGRHVDGLHRERHPAPVGRDLRIGDPPQLHHGIEIERALLGE